MYGNEWEKLKGAKVIGYDVRNAENVLLTLEDGRTALIWVDGDCCSHSYYTDTKQFEELVGTTITDIEERNGKEEEIDYDVIRWHFLVFVTDKGHVTIDWRNDSNGYYDGTANLSISAPEAVC